MTAELHRIVCNGGRGLQDATWDLDLHSSPPRPEHAGCPAPDPFAHSHTPPQVMRDYQSPATIRMYILFAFPMMILYLAPYFALLLQQNPARWPLVFILSNCVILMTALLISVQVCARPLPCLRTDGDGAGGPCAGFGRVDFLR